MRFKEIKKKITIYEDEDDDAGREHAPNTYGIEFRFDFDFCWALLGALNCNVALPLNWSFCDTLATSFMIHTFLSAHLCFVAMLTM